MPLTPTPYSSYFKLTGKCWFQMFIAQSATTTTLDELILGCRCIAPLGQTHFAEYIFPFVDASAIHDTKHNSKIRSATFTTKTVLYAHICS